MRNLKAIFTLGLLSSTMLYAPHVVADPAVFFDANLATGTSNFVGAVNSAQPVVNGGSIKFFRADLGVGVASGATFSAVESTFTNGSWTAVGGGGAIDVAASRNGSGVAFAAGQGLTTFSVSGNSWNNILQGGVNFTFSQGGQAFLVNAVSIQVNDWGTCCATTGVNPDNSTGNPSSVYAVFGADSSTNRLLVGGISSTAQRGTFGGTQVDGQPNTGTGNYDNHLIAAINDTNSWDSFTLVPTGVGEFFGVGGELILSVVAVGSVPAGSSVVSVGNSDIVTTSGNAQASLGSSLNRVFNGGTLTLGGNETGNFTIKSGGGALDPNGGTRTVSGVISDASGATGNLRITGGNGGTVIVTGNNTYTGSTTIGSGVTLAVGNGGTSGSLGSGTIINQGNLIFNRSDSVTIANPFSGGGNLTISGGGTKTITSGSGDLGAITISGNTTAYFNTVTLNTSHAEIVALDENLSPSLIFSGTSLSVEAGSTLRGAGFINAPTTVSGTLRPGNSPGTLVFGASVVQTSTSVLALDIDGPGTSNGAGNYSSVIVTGAGNTFTAAGVVEPILRGITGSANNDYSPAIGSRFTVVSATGGVLGSFTSLTQPASGLLPGTQFDTIYNTNTIQLVITPSNLGAIGGLSPNQTTIANELQAFRPTPGVRPDSNGVLEIFNNLFELSGDEYAGAFNRMSLSIYGDALISQTRAAQSMTGIISEQLSLRRGTTIKQNGSALRFCFNDDVATENRDDCRQITAWGTGAAQFGRTFSQLGDPGYKVSEGGFVLGVDIEATRQLKVGVYGGFTSSFIQSDPTMSKARAGTLNFGVYGAMDWDRFYVNALAGFLTGNQNVSRQPMGGPATGKQDVNGGAFAAEAGFRQVWGATTAEPFVAYRMAALNRGSLTELSASALGASLGNDSYLSSQGILGARLNHKVALNNSWNLLGQLTAAYGYDFGDVTTVTSGAFLGLPGSGVALQSPSIGRSAFLGGVALSLLNLNSTELFIKYDTDLRTDSVTQAVSAGLKVTW